MKHWIKVAIIAGLALAIGLIAWQGVYEVADRLASGGWLLLSLGVFFAVPMGLAALSWSYLFPEGTEPRFPALARATWVAFSVNSLLPVAQIGGELVKARLIVKAGVSGPAAGASVIADKTLQAVTQIAYTVLGLIMLAAAIGGGAYLLPVLGTTVAFAAGIYLFFRVQTAGMFGAINRIGERIPGVARISARFGSAETLDAALAGIYRDRHRIGRAVALRMVSRLAMAGEVWLALLLLDHPVTIGEAIILESLGQAIRAAAFAVPGGLGVQEGGFAVLAVALGFGADVGLALSLAKRFRELVVSLPGLLCWHVIEGRSLLRLPQDDGARPPRSEQPTS